MLPLKVLLGTMMLASCVSSRKPDGLVVVSRHGVRRQFPSSTHDFSKYAPGKDFATEDTVRACICVPAHVWVVILRLWKLHSSSSRAPQAHPRS